MQLHPARPTTVRSASNTSSNIAPASLLLTALIFLLIALVGLCVIAALLLDRPGVGAGAVGLVLFVSFAAAQLSR
ncbi:hypothetical protein SE17_21095 [Kouleothrix aurantiaca]|jgi:hypothetical protein|uniref:Uncharacterized protein n=1 Tax=Kouleothrix aurantiaca TaxID=186479 RepID=A0A0P9DEN0_9CHLR|nr:hypothetical protein SE17_21095 [Kouleothrix aurantiaca]